MKKLFLILLIIVIASLGLVSEDFLKFLLSGHSATKGMILIRHNSLTVAGIALIAIGFTIFLERSRWNRYLLSVSLILLVLSLRTFVIDANNKNIVLVSGFSIFQISKCEFSELDNCKVKFGIFLGGKVQKELNKCRSETSKTNINSSIAEKTVD